MDNLTPITREEMLMNDEPLTPITREEKILAGEDLTPVTRREYFLKKYRHAGGDVMVEGLSVTENGTYTAPEGKAYSPVEVNVPMPENAYLLKTASGSLVSFSDGADLPMPSFICNIDAVQDLHGYDAPWVGGAGKNKFDATIRTISSNGITYTVNDDRTISLQGTASANTSFTIFVGDSSSYIAPFYAMCKDGKEGISLVVKGISVSTNNGQKVYTENAVKNTISLNIANGTVTNCTLKIQMGDGSEIPTTFEPYSNICPISGHTGVDAWVKGKNQLPMTIESIKAANTSGTWSGNTYTYNGIVYTVLTDNNNNITGINADGTATNISYFNIDFGGQIPVGDYYANGGSNGGGYDTYDVYFYNTTLNERMTKWDGTTPSVSLFNTTTSAEIRVPNITDTLRYRIRIRSGIKVEDITFYPMIRLATETDATYEPYNPQSQTIQVSWQTEAGEVFGGYVDLVSGVLTVTRVCVNLKDVTFNGYSGGGLGWFDYNYESAVSATQYMSDRIVLDQDGAWTSTVPCYEIRNYNKGVRVYGTHELFTSGDYADTQFSYPLATPITYQLTPTQIKSLRGNNNAWCSTGDVDINYFAKEVEG